MSNTTKFEGVQALRGVAASMVVFHHFCWVVNQYSNQPSILADFGQLSEVGAGGVDIFFCISGFVITRSSQRFAPGVGRAADFAWRRIVRVVPIYWIFTTLLLLFWSMGIGMSGLIVTPGLVLASYFLIPYPKTTVMGDLSYHPILDIGWTLTFEMYFYAVCAAIILLAGGRRIFPWVLIAILVVALVSTMLTGADSVASSVLASPLLIEFGIGVLFGCFGARLRPTDSAKAQRIGIAAVLLGTIGFAMSIFVRDPVGARVMYWGLPGALLVFGCMLVQIRTEAFLARVIVFLGTASYTIYLAHPFFTLVTGTLLKRGLLQSINADLLLIVMTIGTVAATAASYSFLEGRLVQAFNSSKRVSTPISDARPLTEASG